MATISIQGQTIEETDKSLLFDIRAPFWSAWQMFGWDTREPGIGVNQEIVAKAKREKKAIEVGVITSGEKYRVSAAKVSKYLEDSPNIYSTRTGVKLHILPRSLFTRKTKQ